LYTETDIKKLVDRQKEFFRSGVTLDIDWRKGQLRRLRAAIIRNESKLVNALMQDLGRCEEEAYLTDIGASLLEIGEMIKGLSKWAKPEIRFSGVHCFPSVLTKVYKMPYGTSLVISPFNFPVLLTLGVLTASIAGGNTTVIKASSKSPACTAALKEMIADTFDPGYITVVDGGHDVADMLLASRFDKIFYTGSSKVGVHVMENAAKNLTPVSLELGGETGNWCVVRKDADLRDAARKIAFFKICNSGQICININQVAVAGEVADRFVGELKKAIVRQLGENPEVNPEYAHLINRAAYDNCANEAEQYRDRIVFGGKGDERTLRYSPTIIYPVGADEPIVKHELFNPLLPIVVYRDSEIEDLMDTIAGREHGLALYLFTKDIKWAEKTMSTQQFGGGCVNEVCLHMMVKGVPFNGTGHSGMGAYHGEWGFRDFTHPQTVLYGSTKFNLPLREHPFKGGVNGFKIKGLRALEK